MQINNCSKWLSIQSLSFKFSAFESKLKSFIKRDSCYENHLKESSKNNEIFHILKRQPTLTFVINLRELCEQKIFRLRLTLNDATLQNPFCLVAWRVGLMFDKEENLKIFSLPFRLPNINKNQPFALSIRKMNCLCIRRQSLHLMPHIFLIRIYLSPGASMNILKLWILRSLAELVWPVFAFQLFSVRGNQKVMYLVMNAVRECCFFTQPMFLMPNGKGLRRSPLRSGNFIKPGDPRGITGYGQSPALLCCNDMIW